MKRQPFRFILDDTNTPVPCPDVEQWNEWFATANRLVALSEIGTVGVGTYFTGLDQGIGEALPMLWETLVSSLEPVWPEALTRYYATRQAAEAGHSQIVELLTAEQSKGTGAMYERLRKTIRRR